MQCSLQPAWPMRHTVWHGAIRYGLSLTVPMAQHKPTAQALSWAAALHSGHGAEPYFSQVVLHLVSLTCEARTTAARPLSCGSSCGIHSNQRAALARLSTACIAGIVMDS